MLAVKQAEDEIHFTVNGERVRIKILSLGTRNVRLLLEAERAVTFTFVDSPKKPTAAQRLEAHLKREAKAAARRARQGDTRTRAERAKERYKARREWKTAWKRGISVKHLRKIRAEGSPLPPLKLRPKKAIVRHRFIAEDGATTTEPGLKSKRALERERIAAVKVFTRPAPKVSAQAQPTAKPALVAPCRLQDRRPKPVPPEPQPVTTTRTLNPRTPKPVEPPTSRLVGPGLALQSLPTLQPPVPPVASPEPSKTERITAPSGVVVRRRK